MCDSGLVQDYYEKWRLGHEKALTTRRVEMLSLIGIIVLTKFWAYFFFGEKGLLC